MIGIIILNYNTWDITINCINSIKNNIKETYKIYIVDNNSPQKNIEEQLCTIKSFENTEIIFSERNDGYAAGNNIGLKRAIEDGCNYYCICNSDVLFVDNSLKVLKDTLEKDHSIVIAGPRIYSPDGEFEALTMVKKKRAIDTLRLMALETPLKKTLGWFEKKQIIRDEINELTRVYAVAGSCFMISGHNIDDVYPLDEHTFLFGEEEIIGARIQNARKKVVVVPDTHIIHAHSQSTGAPSRKTYSYMVDSEQYYLREYLHSSWIMRKLILCIRKTMLLIKYR